jgi:hypothetical protein
MKPNKEVQKVIGMGVAVICGVLWFCLEPGNSSTSKEQVREFERELLNAYPPGPRPLPKHLIEKTSFKSKKAISELDDELRNYTTTIASKVTQEYCQLKSEGYTKSEAKEKTLEAAAKTIVRDEDLYTPKQVSAVEELYTSAVKAGIAMCKD